ncbi:MAG TPA: hypothetical protein VJN18_18950 [Polyangiaceae bacterium]|nr:hypothetical protein [Polyangiaceae bacterium]
MNVDRFEQYRRFVQGAPETDAGYLFDRPQTRFWPEPSDELVAAPAQLKRASNLVRVEVAGAVLPLSGLDFATVQAAFQALPCSLGRLHIALGARAPSFIEQTFAKVVFAPGAVAELEVELPSLEIVRFPGSPYEVVRSYWRNMRAVRRRLQAGGLPADALELRSLLLELHELALTGDATSSCRSSFYLPASRLGRKRPDPGSLLTSAARVSVPLLGGQHYWQLLAESVSDEAALHAERHVRVDGLKLGHFAPGREEGESETRSWFIPPRPLEDAHFEALAADLRHAGEAREKGEASAVLAALAAFHYRFVRIHPLPSANQSLSMSFVNAILHDLRGVGIPHHLLDQLALRFDLPAYQRLFARAVAAWSVPSTSPTERVRQLLRMRAELNELISELSKTRTLLEGRALLPERRGGRSLALLHP